MNLSAEPKLQSEETDVPLIEVSCPTISYPENDSDDDIFLDPDEIQDDPLISDTTVANENVQTGAGNTSSEISFDQYEAACEYEPEELEPFDGRMISHLIAQARVSLDLTKITLPTSILERRSFLEMLADFLAHPDEFVKISDQSTPRERFIQVVRWYLSAFHAGRKSTTPKKPYNPILGEVFQCIYNVDESVSDSKTISCDGPVPWSSDNQVTFLAEQTSHHPPISSFYAECPAKKIQIDGCLWTKSRFLGLSIGVHMVGHATLTVIEHEEQYLMTFPSAYGRSILGTPWFEMGGKVSINCQKTNYSATIDFIPKPLFNDRKHHISGSLIGPDKREFAKIDGEWNGTMNIKFTESRTADVFFDTKTSATIPKQVRPIIAQDENESRRLWKDVTFSLKQKNVQKATESKTLLEQTQRNDARERQEKSIKWDAKYFGHVSDQSWTYRKPLIERLKN